jgi:hypothetical protein
MGILDQIGRKHEMKNIKKHTLNLTKLQKTNIINPYDA